MKKNWLNSKANILLITSDIYRDSADNCGLSDIWGIISRKSSGFLYSFNYHISIFYIHSDLLYSTKVAAGYFFSHFIHFSLIRRYNM
jgi:hypothetical protein